MSRIFRVIAAVSIRRQVTRAFVAAGLIGVILALVGVVVPGRPAVAATGINKTINFQGRLLTNSGAVVPDGNYNLRFKLYQDGPGNVAGDTGGTLEWTELWQNSVATGSSSGVVVKNGYFSVTLGTYCAFSGGSCQGNSNTGVNWNQDTLWLSMDVGGTAVSNTPTYDGEMLPMKRLSSAVYALQADNANSLGGLTASQFIQNVAPNAAQQTANFNIVSGAAANVAVAQIQAVASATAPVLVLKGGATPGSGADLLQLQNSTGVALARVDSAGNFYVGSTLDTQSGSTLNIGQTSGGNATAINLNQNTLVNGKHLNVTVNGDSSAFVVNNGTSNVLTVDTSATRVTVGSTSGCSGRLCVNTSVSASGATSTGMFDLLAVNTTGTGTNIGQNIKLSDTSSSIANTNQALVVDTTGTTNTTATTTAILAKGNSTNAGNLLQLQSSGSDVLAVNNAGALTVTPNTNGNVSITTTGTGNINLTTAASVVAKSSLNSAGAFQVQNASGSSLISVDTTAISANLVTNGSFEGTSGTTGWALKGSATISADSSQQVYGNNSLNVTTTTTANDGVKYPVTLSAGTQYTLTFYAKLSSGSFSSFDYGYAQDGSTENTSGLWVQNSSVSTGGWQRYRLTFTPSAVSGTPYLFFKQDNGSTARTFYIDGVSLEAQATSNIYDPYKEGKIQLNGAVSSPLVVQPTAMTNALEVVDPTGQAVLSVDTFNRRVGIGVNQSIGARLEISNNLTGAPALKVSSTTTSGSQDLLQISNTALNSGNNVLTINNSGAVAFRNATNSTSAFQIQNSSAAPVLNVDTTASSTNLVTNPSFEVDTSGWAQRTGCTLSRVTSPVLFGAGAARCTNTATVGAGTNYATGALTAVTYTMSFYAKAAGTFSTFAFGYSPDGSDETTNLRSAQTVNSTGWTRYTLSFTGSTNAAGYLFFKQTDSASGHDFIIDGVQLETGSTATAYQDSRFSLDSALTSSMIIQPAENSTTALAVYTASGSQAFNVNTLNNRVGIGSLNASARLHVAGSTSNIPVGIFQGASGQSVDILQIQDSNSNALAGFDSGGQLYVGRASGLTGSAKFYNASGAGSISLQANNPGATNYTINLPAENGTVCTSASGSSTCTGNFILNQNSSDQTANFRMLGAGQITGQAAGSSTALTLLTGNATNKGLLIQGASSQSADLLTVQDSSATVNYLKVTNTGTTITTDTTTAAGNKFTANNSATSGFVNGNWLQANVAPASNSSGTYLGNYFALDTTTNVNFTGDLIAALGQVDWNSTGTSTTGTLVGVLGKVNAASGSGNVATAIGVEASGQYTGGTITTHYGLYSTINSATTATILNDYGLKIDAVTRGTQSNYAIATDGGQVRFTGNSLNQFQIQNGTFNPALNVDTGTSNLITNNGFEVDTSSWSPTSNASLSTTNAQSTVEGNSALDVNITGSGSNLGASTTSFTQTVAAGTYTLSFYAKSGAALSTLRAGYNATACTLNSNTLSTTLWQRYSCTFTAGATVTSIFIDKGASASTLHLYLDAVQLEAAGAAGVFRDGKVAVGGSLYVNGGQLAAAQSNYALQVSGLNGGGGVLVQGSSDTTGASKTFQVQNADSTTILGVDATGNSANLIGNPSMETGTTGWSVKGGCSMSNPTTTAAFGSRSLLCDNSTTNPSGATYPVTLTSGHDYTLSAYVKAASSFATFEFGVSISGNNETTCTSSGNTVGASSGWLRVSVHCSAVASPSGSYVYFKKDDAVATSDFYLDGVMLEDRSAVWPSAYRESAISMDALVTSSLVVQPTDGTSTGFAVNSGANGNSVFQVDTDKEKVSVGLPGTGNSWPDVKMFVVSGSYVGLRVLQTGSNDIMELANANGQVFIVDSTGDVQIGLTAGDTTGTTLRLGVKTNAGDPASPQNGQMYYNSNANKFRCYQNSAWVDCAGANPVDWTNVSIQSPAADGGVGNSLHRVREFSTGQVEFQLDVDVTGITGSGTIATMPSWAIPTHTIRARPTNTTSGTVFNNHIDIDTAGNVKLFSANYTNLTWVALDITYYP